MDRRHPFQTLSPHARRLLVQANLWTSILLACALFGMTVYLSSRHFSRRHWSRNPAAHLSGRTQQLLEDTAADIRISVLLRPGHEAYRSTIRLLQEYAAATPGLALETIDPDRDLARTEGLVRRYNLPAAEGVVFEIGGRHRLVPADSLIERLPLLNRSGASRRVFRGEQLFSSAIYALTRADRPAVLFLQGHGERSPEDFDRRSGYSRIAARLRDDNLDLELLNLGETKTIPGHCALLVIAGPVREFAPFEIAQLRDYLDRKGRLLLLLDARTPTGLEILLLDWGVLLGGDVVVDETRTLGGRELYVAEYNPHPITDPLLHLASVFHLPRSVRPQPAPPEADKPFVLPLASCSAAGWAEFDPDDPALHFDPRVDIAGPVPVAVAVERGPVPGVHVQIRPTRLVVFGDSDFAANGGLMGANADLFLNAANWLLDRQELLALPPRTLDEIQVVLDARQLRRLFLAVVVCLPGLVAAAGLWVAWRRR